MLLGSTSCGLPADSCNCSRISTPSMPIQETIEPVGKGSKLANKLNCMLLGTLAYRFNGLLDRHRRSANPRAYQQVYQNKMSKLLMPMLS
jgi:hypothetical protein